MNGIIDILKSRWDSDKGRNFINMVLKRDVSLIEYQSACRLFFGRNDSIIKSDTPRGLGDFEDLRGVDFSLRDLRNLVFAKSDLSYANLKAAQLAGSSFSNAKFFGASFENVIASARVDFFECFGHASNFSGANMVDSIFYNSDFTNANFTNAVLKHCDLGGAIFSNATLDGMIMVGCDVVGAYISEEHQESDWFRLSSLINREKIKWI